MTLRWFGPGSREYAYHCDFVFLSGAIAHRLEDVTVGTMAEWVESGPSDHTPVVAHIGARRRVSEPTARPDHRMRASDTR